MLACLPVKTLLTKHFRATKAPWSCASFSAPPGPELCKQKKGGALGWIAFFGLFALVSTPKALARPGLGINGGHSLALEGRSSTRSWPRQRLEEFAHQWLYQNPQHGQTLALIAYQMENQIENQSQNPSNDLVGKACATAAKKAAKEIQIDHFWSLDPSQAHRIFMNHWRLLTEIFQALAEESSACWGPGMYACQDEQMPLFDPVQDHDETMLLIDGLTNLPQELLPWELLPWELLPQELSPGELADGGALAPEIDRVEVLAAPMGLRINPMLRFFVRQENYLARPAKELIRRLREMRALILLTENQDKTSARQYISLIAPSIKKEMQTLEQILTEDPSPISQSGPAQ
jgi:hypothetical protein